MGQIVFSSPEVTELSCLGLGSCIGLCVADPKLKVVCVAHVVLPQSRSADTPEPAKYADTAIPHVIKELTSRGARKERLRAAIVGGAQLFSFSGANESMDVGKRNIEAVKKHLADNRISVVAEDVGGRQGRTVVMDAKTGDIVVKQSGATERWLTNLLS